VSLLEPGIYDNLKKKKKKKKNPIPYPILVNGKQEYEVKFILDSKRFNKKVRYLIYRKQYDDFENSLNFLRIIIVINFLLNSTRSIQINQN